MTRIDADWLNSVPSQQVCSVLTNAGYQAWFVGGCVRNALLGVPVADLDLTTDAHPEVVMRLAKAAGLRVLPTGIEHGTVTIITENAAFEVTTFRRDVETDGRRATVAFADNITDDARRRDFTMNALYAGPDGKIADPLGGLPDLENRRVRFIEDPEQRIREDYLRILRYFRFHAFYGDPNQGPDPNALAACAANIEGLQRLSSERVTSELLKLLSAPNPAPSVAAMASTGALMQVLPGADHGFLAVLVHVEQAAGMKPDPVRRLAILGGDRDGLRLSKAQARQLDQISCDFSNGETAYRFGDAVALDKLAVESATMGHEIDPKKAKFANFAAIQQMPIKAVDLMDRFQGPALGRALKEAEARWIASDFSLTKEELLR